MGNQQLRVLESLKRGETLTALSAWKNYGISRLSARISELRQAGYNIESYRRETVNMFNEPTHYAEYYLKQEKEI